jgi:hypothetical protein
MPYHGLCAHDDIRDDEHCASRRNLEDFKTSHGQRELELRKRSNAFEKASRILSNTVTYDKDDSSPEAQVSRNGVIEPRFVQRLVAVREHRMQRLMF